MSSTFILALQNRINWYNPRRSRTSGMRAIRDAFSATIQVRGCESSAPSFIWKRLGRRAFNCRGAAALLMPLCDEFGMSIAFSCQEVTWFQWGNAFRLFPGIVIRIVSRLVIVKCTPTNAFFITNAGGCSGQRQSSRFQAFHWPRAMRSNSNFLELCVFKRKDVIATRWLSPLAELPWVDWYPRLRSS